MTRAIALAIVLSLTGCATRTAKTSALAGAQAPGAPYVIRVGDYLDVRFYKTPEMNVEVPVRADGKISLEVLGDVQAAGLEPAELSRMLSERYASELTDPRVTVIVRAFGGRIFVGGEVKTPSAVPFATGMTALQAIDGAGGFLDTAKPESVVLIRQVDGHAEGHRLALDRALKGKDLGADVVLQPDDIIHVPKSGIANVNLLVDQYIRKNIPIPNPGVGGAF